LNKTNDMNSNTMKAMLLEQHGAAYEAVTIPRPEAGKDQVLVKIMASGINPLDLKIKNGKGGHARQPLPAILGLDLAGVVEAVGEGVTAFAPGDEVYGMVGGVGGLQGTLAQYAAVDADLLAPKPKNLTMKEAAAIPLVLITAWEGMVDRAGVQAGQKVLIHGGAGGVGHMAVQLALAYGAEVYATASAPKHVYLQQLWATPIDYNNTTVEEYVATYTGGEGFDIIYDTVGGANLDASFKAIKSYGHVVSALGREEHNLAPLAFHGGTYSAIFTLLPMLTGKGRAHHGDILKEATKLAEAGKLKPLVDENNFTLETVEEAYQLMEQGKAKGKLVVNISH
jgi:NADPH2:quinone reductase